MTIQWVVQDYELEVWIFFGSQLSKGYCPLSCEGVVAQPRNASPAKTLHHALNHLCQETGILTRKPCITSRTQRGREVEEGVVGDMFVRMRFSLSFCRFCYYLIVAGKNMLFCQHPKSLNEDWKGGFCFVMFTCSSIMLFNGPVSHVCERLVEVWLDKCDLSGLVETMHLWSPEDCNNFYLLILFCPQSLRLFLDEILLVIHFSAI